jgi:hypothetical protein
MGLIGLPIQEFADMQKLLDSMPRAWRIVVSATDKKDIGETLDEANKTDNHNLSAKLAVREAILRK